METEFRRPFRLDDFPLCRFALLHLAASRHIWFMAFHQLVIDAIGGELFCARVVELYAARLRGVRPGPRPSPSIAEVRTAEAAYLASPRAAVDRAYWLARLKDPPEPLVEVDPALSERTRSGRASRSAFTLPAERADALRVAAAALGVSMARLLAAMAAIGFTRWYHAGDLFLGITLNHRIGARMRGAIGPFSRYVPLRLTVERAAPLGEAVRAVAALLRRDARHRHFPVHELRGPLGLSRQGRRFSDVTLNYLATAPGVTFDGAPVRVESFGYGLICPWTITWVDPGRGTALATTIDYDPGAVPAAEAEQVAEALRCLLEAAPTSLGVPVAALPIMRPASRADMLRWSAGETVAVPQDATLASLVAAQAQRTPQATALVVGEERLDYATLHRRAAELAPRLAAAGVRRGSVVGLALPRTAALLQAVLAVHLAGGAYLPLDPALPAERLDFMCADAGVQLLLTTAATIATLAPALARLPCRIARLDVAADLPPAAAGTACDAPAPDDLAYVLYTSGSTGRPKGVGVAHRSVVNFLHWARSVVEPDDLAGVLFSTPLGFDIAVLETFLPLAFGGRIVHGRQPSWRCRRRRRGRRCG